MTDNTPDYEKLEWDKDGRVLDDDPHALLDLPEGLLALEGLPVAFAGAVGYPVTKDKVLDAARCIIENRTPEQRGHVFHNQAQVMAFASREFGWLTGKEMGLAAVANYMGLPKQGEEEKEIRTEMLDGLIDVLRSGLLTTREGAKKLFPDMDVDAVFDRHEQFITEAVEEQQRQMKEFLRTLGKDGDAPAKDGKSKDDSLPQDDQWAEKVAARRRHKPNPCLGF